MFDQFSRQRAGNALSRGDFAGGANALYRGGLLDEGAGVQRMQQGQEDRALRLEDRRLEIDAKAQEREQEQVKQRIGFFKQAASVLTKIPDDGTQAERRKALQQLTPTFEMMGLEPQLIQQLQSADLSDQSLQVFLGEIEKAEVEFIKGSDGSYTAASKATGLPLYQYQAPTPDKFEQFDPEKEIRRIPGRPGGPVAGAQPSAGFDANVGPLLQREGGFVARDGRSGAPANFGINQRYNPDVDVSKLTEDQARQLYRDRYWNAINGDSLPPEAQAAVFDAAVNQGPERAMSWWRQSGGDVQKFNQLRLQHYRSRPDYARNGRSWERRVAETGGSSAPGAPELVRGAQPKAQERWEDLPGGGQINTKTGEKKNVPGDGKATDGDKQATAFAYRTVRANGRLNALADRGIYKPRTATAQLFDTDKNGVVRVITKTAEDRQFIQAAKEWLAPVLRKDTGAAVTDGELATYMDIYIPRFEDDPTTQRQKAEARQDAMVALLNQAGPLYTRTYGKERFRSRFEPPKQPAKAPPKPGAVVKGYRFKGGDPANRASWVKI
jgi:hypothetical protein